MYTHPIYNNMIDNWTKWRLVYECDVDFIEEYLRQFSYRESPLDFAARKLVTPIPAFAKGAINEIKNSIFGRMRDVARVGGAYSYQQAIKGHLGGVNLAGATMNWFIGDSILPELLTMAKVGVFVDNAIVGESLADKGNKHPYFYTYRAEDILNWQVNTQNQLTQVFLRDSDYQVNNWGLPVSSKQSFRRVYLNNTGTVTVEYYDGDLVLQNQVQLNLPRIPFVIFALTDSLIKDVANHQIALLNMESSDIAYSLRANFPFYTEKVDPAEANSRVKKAQEAYQQTQQKTPQVPSSSVETTQDVVVGTTRGRRYTSERPGFIAPPTEPLQASMEKEANLKQDIRVLVHLALSNIQAKMASAESKEFDQRGLEAGLAYIGLELEYGERQLGELWQLYDDPTGTAPTINYPARYSLKSAAEQKDEIEQLRALRDDIPSTLFQKKLNMRIVELCLGSDLTPEDQKQIQIEIQNSPTSSANPKIITQDLTNGILGKRSAAKARGYSEEEVDIADKEHTERLARIAEAQSKNTIKNPQARGLPDLATDNQQGKDEKQGKRKRGENKL